MRWNFLWTENRLWWLDPSRKSITTGRSLTPHHTEWSLITSWKELLIGGLTRRWAVCGWGYQTAILDTLIVGQTALGGIGSLCWDEEEPTNTVVLTKLQWVRQPFCLNISLLVSIRWDLSYLLTELLYIELFNHQTLMVLFPPGETSEWKKDYCIRWHGHTQVFGSWTLQGCFVVEGYQPWEAAWSWSPVICAAFLLKDNLWKTSNTEWKISKSCREMS